jgi:predicted O-methyltransferase YrrM
MLTATLFNQKTMLVDDADSLGIMANGIFEPIETHTVLALVKGGDRVLDIGANMGYYTVLMAEKVGAQGKVFAVEPNAANLSILHANTLRRWTLSLYR